MSASRRWRTNDGKFPADLRGKGKRIGVELRNGRVAGFEPIAAATPAGWALDGNPAPRFTLRDDPFDIMRFVVL